MLSQSKIENFRLAAGGDEDIRGLDIAMNDAARMGGIERIGDLRAEIEQGIRGHGPAADAFTKRLPFKDFHHQIGAPIVFADVVNRADSGMIQRRCGARFALEAFERGRIACEVRGEKFERDLTTQARIFRAKYLPHAAAAQRVENAVMRDCFADHCYVRSNLFARHRKQLRAMAQAAKRERIRVWRRKRKVRKSPNAGREGLVPRQNSCNFCTTRGFHSPAAKGAPAPGHNRLQI